MLFEEKKKKVSFRHCLRGTQPGVESAHGAQRMLECHKVAWSFSPLGQTFGVMGCSYSCGKN